MNQSRFDHLLDGMVAGILTESEQAELDQLIVQDPAAARQVARMFNLGRELTDCLRPSSQRLPVEMRHPNIKRPTSATKPSIRRPSQRLTLVPLPRFMAIIAVLAALVVVVVVLTNPPEARDNWIEGQVEIIRIGQDASHQSLSAGTQIHANGQATLFFADGTRVQCNPGTHLTLDQGPGKQLHLNNGVVHARVAKQPSETPFIIKTAHAQLSVVGTSFTLSAQQNQTELVVDDGAVRMLAPGIDLIVSRGQRQVVVRPAVTTPLAAIRQEKIIAHDAVWAFRDDGIQPDINWQQPGFNDHLWGRGAAPLGYDRDEERKIFATHIGSRNSSVITCWFRHEFQCDNPEDIQNLIIRFQRDDGAVIYLNGQEVMRSSMPEGLITPQTLALREFKGRNQDHIYVNKIPASALRKGRNCISVEVHQISADSTDLLFSLELKAEVAQKAGAAP